MEAALGIALGALIAFAMGFFGTRLYQRWQDRNALSLERRLRASVLQAPRRWDDGGMDMEPMLYRDLPPRRPLRLLDTSLLPPDGSGTSFDPGELLDEGDPPRLPGSK
jgi:hypothetical protein